MPKVRVVSELALILLSLTRDYHDNHGRYTVTVGLRHSEKVMKLY